jgi:hypothetical protein
MTEAPQVTSSSDADPDPDPDDEPADGVDPPDGPAWATVAGRSIRAMSARMVHNLFTRASMAS